MLFVIPIKSLITNIKSLLFNGKREQDSGARERSPPLSPPLFVPIAGPPRDAASGASHLSATIVSALVHGYVSTTLFRFVIFVFRPIVACQLSHLHARSRRPSPPFSFFSLLECFTLRASAAFSTPMRRGDRIAFQLKLAGACAPCFRDHLGPQVDTHA